MSSNNMTKRLLSLFLVLCMVCAWIIPASAQESGISITQVSNDRVSAGLFGKDPVQLEEEPQYADDEIVRVSIFLDRAGVIDAGFAVQGLAVNQEAMAYREELQAHQSSIVDQIEMVIDEELDVIWHLTLATNLISANVKYGHIAAIEKIAGVTEVVIETVYAPDVVSSSAADPNMATSSFQTGTMPSYAAGYTGAGSRVAIIDTGLDTKHLSFDATAYEYSLSLLAEKANLSVEDYMASLNLLDAEEIAAVLGQLNLSTRANVSAEQLYINSKIPFGFNYVDRNLNVEHLSDGQGEHGSHVAGIATANAYVPTEDGFAKALEEVFVQGVAPDAQVIVMKVFGATGGAYDSDYMVAIEDAILLGVDSVNLSLGSGNPGMSRNSNAQYQAILDNLQNSGVVVSMSAGNSGAWMDSVENGVPYLYLDDVSMQTNGSPGSFTNSLSVASVDNAGFVSSYTSIVVVNGEHNIFYYDSNVYGTSYGNAPFITLAGKHEYVFLNNIGTSEQFAALGEDAVKGKIALCYRGENSFVEKAHAAVEAGAIGVIVVNNVDELFGMNLTGYVYTAPVVSITLSAGEAFKATPIEGENGEILGWTGTLEVPSEPFAGLHYAEYYTMSSFSSWGVPGSLELKPEITAPGGNILSVNGANTAYGNYAHDQYEVMSGTSMAAPQVAGMAALVAQFIRENNLEEKTGLNARTLAQSLLMSTAIPVLEGANGGYYYSVLKQGAGLANVGAAVMADSYILMNPNATASWADGKVKVELGDDPNKAGVYTFAFTINNLTDSEKVFALAADFFTQNAFAYGNALYLDTMTTPLQPIVVFTVNGKSLEGGAEMFGLDFNGDGYVNTTDGMALLDYAAGVEVTLTNVAAADLSNDGVVNSYDAYLFFKQLGESGAVVPANGSSTVEVTVTLSDSDKRWLANYENGAYLEGFVYAESVVDSEGVEGTSHSIPVLGFFGNWSDASMFEKGSFEEYQLSGEETRAPYLLTTAYGKGQFNSLYVTYANDPGNVYYFGGNPIVEDAVYMPERNAISGVNGDVISKLGFTSIRNAAASFYQVLDLTNQQVLANQPLGVVSSAYYHVNTGVWKQTYLTLNTNLSLKGLADNTQVQVGLCLIPEYYVDANGNVNTASLGKGTTFAMSMTVDNTAPVLQNVALDEATTTLNISATDNQYIAAVALLDSTGRTVYALQGSVADAKPNDACNYSLELDGINGSSFLLQIYDYAMNCTTYELEMQLGEVVDYVDSITLSETNVTMVKGRAKELTATVMPTNAKNRDVIWSSSDESVVTVENGVVKAVGAGNAVITATAAADETVSATCSITVIEMNITVQGVLQDAEGKSMFYNWNMQTDSTWTGGVAIDTSMTSATVDTLNNKVYIMDAVANSWSMHLVDPATGTSEQVGTNGAKVPMWDMEYSSVFSTADAAKVSAVYGYYFFPVKDPMALNTSVFNLSTYLTNYTRASYLVAIASAGYEKVSNKGVIYETEHIMMLDNAGYVWDFWIYPTADGSFGALLNFAPSDLSKYGLTFPGYENDMYTSMVVGDDGHLYLSAFTGQTNEIYRLVYNASTGDYSAMLIGDVGADVWPAIITSVTANAASTADSVACAEPTMQMHTVTVTAEELAAVVENEPETPAQPMNGAVLDVINETMIVEITAKDLAGMNVPSTNGVITVNYNPAVQSLQNVIVHGDYYSVINEDGSVTVAYVKVDEFAADDVVVSLVFNVVDATSAGVTVEYKEINEGYDLGNEEEVKPSVDESLLQAIAALEEAVKKLEEAIAAGDEANAKALAEAIVALEQKLAEAIAALETADKTNRTELENLINEAKTTLNAAIEKVAADLELAKQELTAAMNEGDKALDEKIAALNAALEAAIAASSAADDALRGELNGAIAAAVETLNAAIEKVAADLAAAEKELTDAMNSGDKALEAKINAVNTALQNAVAAYRAADSALKSELSAQIASANASLRGLVDQLNNDLAKAQKDLSDAIKAGDKALDDKIAALNTALEAAITAANAADEALKAELNATIEEAVAALEAAIAAVAENLEKAQQELQDAMDEGDKMLGIRLDAMGDAVTVALEAAKAAALASDEALSAELNARIDEAVNTLNAAIAQVQKNLDEAKAALNAKDDQLAAKDAEHDAELARLNTFVIVVCVIACVAVVGCAAVAFVVLKKKR